MFTKEWSKEKSLALIKVGKSYLIYIVAPVASLLIFCWWLVKHSSVG